MVGNSAITKILGGILQVVDGGDTRQSDKIEGDYARATNAIIKTWPTNPLGIEHQWIPSTFALNVFGSGGLK